MALTLEGLAHRIAHLEAAERPITGVHVRVYNSANITLTSGVVTALTFDSERWDTGGLHSTSVNTDRLTCVTPGLYHLEGYVNFMANATGTRQLQIILNGATQIAVDERTADPTRKTYMVISCDWLLAAGDYVQLKGWQNCGGNLDIEASAARSPEFSATRVP